ncbi:hypothetical protein [Singulisphaera sp. PoT]|uniref:hypothetical protein n=1 Tax=Singulisphaera sp. PoT TaxID=3411797 RepID=UPI003BF4F5E8
MQDSDAQDDDEVGADILTVQECSAVVMAALLAAPGGAMPEDDARQIADWAANTRRNATMLDLVLEGRVEVKIADGMLAFHKTDDDEAERRGRILADILSGETSDGL